MLRKIKLLYLEYKKRKFMKELNNYLFVFNNILDNLKKLGDETNPNIRLGGSLILKLHGLNFSRKSGDLDVIVDNPTEGQKNYMQGMQAISTSNCGDYSEDSFKVAISGCYMNILIKKPGIVYPKLYYVYGSTNYSICSIDEIITAKKDYGRKKDLIDFQMLKNENFNV